MRSLHALGLRVLMLTGDNAVSAGLLYPAFGILLNPMLASLAMSLSSISVIARSLRLRRFQA